MASGWKEFFLEIETLFAEVERRQSCDFVPVLEGLLCMLLKCVGYQREAQKLVQDNDDDESCNYLCNHLDLLLSYLLKDSKVLEEKISSLSRNENAVRSPTSLVLIRNGFRGHPKIDVDIDRVCTLREMGFSWISIAKFIGISRTTLYKKCKEANILPTYTCNPNNPTDIKIDNVIKGIKDSMPHAGERMVIGHLTFQSTWSMCYKTKNQR